MVRPQVLWRYYSASLADFRKHPMTDAATTWPLQAARDQLSQLVKAAATAPQTVTVHGKAAAVVLSPQDYARLKNAPRQRLSAELLRPGLLQDDDAALFDRQPDDDSHRDIAL